MLQYYKVNDQIVIGGDQGIKIIPNTVDAVYEKHMLVTAAYEYCNLHGLWKMEA